MSSLSLSIHTRHAAAFLAVVVCLAYAGRVVPVQWLVAVWVQACVVDALSWSACVALEVVAVTLVP